MTRKYRIEGTVETGPEGLHYDKHADAMMGVSSYNGSIVQIPLAYVKVMETTERFRLGCTAKHADFPQQLWYRHVEGWQNLAAGADSEFYYDHEMQPELFTFWDPEGNLIND